MLHSVMQQFLRQTSWGELDFLLIDLPPGTGDVALSLVQTAPLSGAVIVTTPSDVSLEDARKAINMFRQVRVEILGLIENMSYLIAPQSKERIDVFGTGGGKRTAETMGIHFLGELPLDPAIRKGGDSGRPVAFDDAPEFVQLAKAVVERLEVTGGSKPPVMTVSE
jgi:ATP-binding protein involved in chromosome partitioning